ncbi:MAG: 50S ribosomal protein L32 [Propionibacteriaceae bacterium]|nr:50S ribosomal protein L32 [Propionibacteriaceae bacterium]
MAVPKRRMSRSNTRSRRSQFKAAPITLTECANPACKAKHPSHTVCPECGQYGTKGKLRQVVSIEA